MIQHHGPNPIEIKNLFSSVAGRYDAANDAMTFGIAHRWRRKVVRWSGARAGDRVLDCATGTGDLAIAFKRAVGDSGQVIGTDFCESMLEKAPPKARSKGLEIDFQIADAMNLPYEDNSFDISSIAYGIRNVEDPKRALSEMARVVKPGGRVMVLETGEPGALKTFFEFYFQRVIPRVGGWLTGQPWAYEYLNRSSLAFPSREKFLEIMNSTGAFTSCDYRTLMGGASFVYRGVVK